MEGEDGDHRPIKRLHTRGTCFGSDGEIGWLVQWWSASILLAGQSFAVLRNSNLLPLSSRLSVASIHLKAVLPWIRARVLYDRSLVQIHSLYSLHRPFHSTAIYAAGTRRSKDNNISLAANNVATVRIFVLALDRLSEIHTLVYSPSPTPFCRWLRVHFGFTRPRAAFITSHASAQLFWQET